MALPLLALAIVLRELPDSVTVPTTPGEFWSVIEGVAAVAVVSLTIGLGFIAWYGLKSVRLFRDDMVTRSKRESIAIAVAQAERFSVMIRERHLRIQEALHAAKLPQFTQKMASGVAVFDPDVMYKDAKHWWDQVPSPTQNEIIYFLNDVEAWAMNFTKSLGETEVVLSPCAPTFCSIIMQYSPWIVVVRKEQYAGYYPNIIELFNSWRAELDANDRGAQTEAALRSARAAEARRQQLKLPPPLGTDVED
jgi:hypothetical protein